MHSAAPATTRPTITFDTRINHYRTITPFSMKAIMQAIPGRLWDKDNKQWIFPATGATAWKLARAFKCQFKTDCITPPDGVSVCDELLEKAHRFNQAQRLLRGEINLPVPLTKTKPFQHQEFGLKLAILLDGFYLAWDMGTGKTKTAIDIVTTTGAKRSLVVCPSRVIHNWPGQWKTHGERSTTVLPLIDAPIAQRAKALEAYIGANVPFVAVINYEAFWREPIAELIYSTFWDVIISDEAHRCKDPDGKASKFLYSLVGRANKRVALSGTPIPNNPLDLFAQLRFVDPGIFGTSYFSFRAKYAVMGGFQSKNVVNFRNLEELNRQFYLVSHKVGVDEVLDLPQATHIFEKIQLEPDALKQYKAIENDFVAEVGKGTVTVSNALVEIIRLQQITGGFLVDDDGNVHNVSKAKGERLREILEDLPPQENIVVFCKYRHDLDLVHGIAKSGGRVSEELSGRGKSERPEWVNDITWEIIDGVKMTKWRPGNNKASILVVQIQAGGVGVDFTEACRAFYFSQTHNNGDYLQSLARIRRQGQKRPCFYYHFVCEGTIDEKIYKSIARKTSIADLVMSEASGKEPLTEFDQIAEEIRQLE